MTKPEQDEARDAAAVDALYDPRSRAGADGALTSELAGLDRVRALYRELAEEDPPSAATAKLMAAAAARGRAKAASGGGALAWLRDLLQPLAASPALGAAASLVIVVGVAGLLYVRGKDEIARPDVSGSGSTTAAEAPAADPAAPARGLPESLAPQAAPLTGSSPGAPADEADEAQGEAVDGEVAPELRRGGAVEAKRERPARSTSERSASGRSMEGGLVDPSEGGVGKSMPRKEAGGADGFDDRAGSAPAAAPSPTRPFNAATPTERAEAAPEAAPPSADTPPQKKKAAAPEPVRPPPPAAPSGAPSATGAGADEAPAGGPDREVTRLHAEAAARAARGDCAAARAASSKIRQRDPAYHAARVATDRRLAPCLQTKK